MFSRKKGRRISLANRGDEDVLAMGIKLSAVVEQVLVVPHVFEEVDSADFPGFGGEGWVFAIYAPI